MRIIKEIKAVGFKDWFWFVFVLRRNEFSDKLSIRKYINLYKDDYGFNKLMKDRDRAHKIDPDFWI